MDSYAIWKAALKGTPIDWDNAENISGFYRVQAAKTKPDMPAAIWPNKAGQQVLKRGRMNVVVDGSTEWHEFIAGTWPKCKAVTKDEYDDALIKGYWPDDNKPSRQPDAEPAPGPNDAPAEETLADQITSLAEIIEAAPDPSTQDEANRMVERTDRLYALLAKAEKARKAENEPSRLAVIAINAKWHKITEPGDTAYAKGYEATQRFLKKEKARVEAIAIEERRIENERVKIENDRIRAENARVLKEAADKRQAEIDALPIGVLPSDREEAPPPELIPEVKAEVIEAPKVQASSAFGRAKGVKKTRVGVVDDPMKMVESFIASGDLGFASYLQDRAQAVARMPEKTRVLIPGMHVEEE